MNQKEHSHAKTLKIIGHVLVFVGQLSLIIVMWISKILGLVLTKLGILLEKILSHDEEK